MINLLVSILLFIGNPTENRYLSSIQISRTSDKSGYYWENMVINKLDTVNISYDLEVGWILEAQTLKLVPKTSQSAKFKVEIQYETSLTVMDEGSHIDLIDWKHYVSKWREINAQSKNTYLIPKFTDEESSRFPKVSKNEMYDAIMKRGCGRWLDLVQKADMPTQYPCGVGISMYTIRISVLENGSWVILNEIEFNMPMGC
jgi:hypothetical protein